jgi:tetratricopeptide (TPR) repeat protein
LAAFFHHLIDLNNWTDDLMGNRQEGLRHAREALQFGADAPVALAYARPALGWFGEDIDAARQLAECSVALNPGYARGWFYRGQLNLYAGRTEPAVEDFETFFRLDPRANRGTSLAHMGIAHFFKKRFEEASKKLVSALEENQSFITAYRFLAARYAHRGLREARDVIERLRTRNPAVWPNTVPYRNPEHRDCISRACASQSARRRPGPEPLPRQILAADVAGYSRLMRAPVGL